MSTKPHLYNAMRTFLIHKQKPFKTMKSIEKINYIPLPESIHSVRTYRDEDGQPWVDIVAWRTYNQADENQRFVDLCHIENEIESLGFDITQNGTIDNEEGRGWIYKIEEGNK